MGRSLSFSIVTPCYNAARFIGEAVESVAQQQGEVAELEHIVADAESSDGTAEVLSRFPHLRVDRRKDLGIYDGMNRAIALAKGDIIGIVNADDVLAPHALSRVAEVFADTGADIVTGAFEVIDQDGGACSGPFRPTCTPTYEGLLFGIPAINARFFRRSVFVEHGPFELELGLAADRAWLLNMQRTGLRFAHTENVLYRYRRHDGSQTLAGDAGARDRVWRENIAMADMLLQRMEPGESGAAALKALSAVEAAKIAVTGITGKGKQNGTFGRAAAARQMTSVLLGSPHHLMRGLRCWRRFRDHHSDTQP